MESEKRFSLQKSEICSKVFTDKSNEWDKGRILTSYLARRAKHLSLLRSSALLALAYWSLQCSAMWVRPIVIIACSSMMMLLPPPPSSSAWTLNQNWEISFQKESWLNFEDSNSYSLNCLFFWCLNNFQVSLCCCWMSPKLFTNKFADSKNVRSNTSCLEAQAGFLDCL